MKKTFFKTKTKTLVIYILAIVLLASCKKEYLVKSDMAQPQIRENNKPELEKVDLPLLEKFMLYGSSLAAASMITESGSTTEPNFPKIKPGELMLMINNFLANERNDLRQQYFMHKSAWSEIDLTYAARKDSQIITLPTVTCVGTFTGQNSISTILFQSNYLPSNTLVNYGFSFGGMGGGMSPAKPAILTQNVYQGVITYGQYFTETINQSNGGQYTQLYYLYGNVYQGACTVHGIRVIAPE